MVLNGFTTQPPEILGKVLLLRTGGRDDLDEHKYPDPTRIYPASQMNQQFPLIKQMDPRCV